MERYQLSDARSFAFLTRLSQHRNVRLNKIAQELTALFVPTKTGKGIWNQGIVFRILRTKTTEELLKAAA